LRSTAVIALAVLLAALPACLQAQAVELIDLHDLHAAGRATLIHDHASADLSAYLADSLSGYRIGHHAGYLAADEPAGIPGGIFAAMPLPAESWPATAMLEAAPSPMPTSMPMPLPMPVPTPVPEPISVLMLACGLLLIMPGAWAARWSRLGDNESLLQRRLP
jgi:hypothetical protein